MSTSTIERAPILINETPPVTNLVELQPASRDPQQLGETALHIANVGIVEESPQHGVHVERVREITSPLGSLDWDWYHPDVPFESRSIAVLTDHFKIDAQTAEAALQQAEIMQPHARVAVRLPLANLGSVLKDGRLKSMHETHTSTGQGSGGSNDRYTRREVEREKFNQLESEPPIIYGFLEDSLTATSDVIKLRNYGDVELLLKPEVATRSSFTEGDSLRTGKTAPVLNFEDAVLAKQINDTLDQQGKAFYGYRQSGIEAQIFGGVNLEDIEAVNIFMSPHSLDTQVANLEELHIIHPDIRMSVNLDFSEYGEVPIQLITNHPYIEFTPVVVADEISRLDKMMKTDEDREYHRLRYDKSVARKNSVQQSFDKWWGEHPEEDKPSNLGSVKLIFN